jgi:long-chain fatty acid transport protein
MSHRILVNRLAACMALAGCANFAHAAGFALIEQNASGLGNAFAGQAAVAADASTIFFNPAGMGLLPGSQLVVTGSLVDLSAKFLNGGSTAAPLQALGDTGGDAGGLSFVPNAYYVYPVNKDLALGIGVNAPFGLKTEYDQTWMGRFQAVKSELQTVNVNPSLSYKLNDTVLLGIGLSAQYIDATLTNMANYSAAIFNATNGVFPNLQGLAEVKGNDWGWGYNLGALFNLGDTRIGIAYRSKVDYTLEGDVSFANVPPALAAALPNGPVTADVAMPASASLSLFHKLSPSVDLLADITWTGWSTFDVLTVRRTSGSVVSSTTENWQDNWRYSLGVTWHQNDAWTWRAGVAYDQTPVEDTYRTARIPDNSRTWVALGGQYRLSEKSALDFGYAYLFVKDASIDSTVAGAGTLLGSYNNSVNILSAQYTYTF